MPFVDIKSNIIHIDANITMDNSVIFLATFSEMLKSANNKPITIHVTSTGGSTSAAIAIAQMMRTSGIPVATEGRGCVESAAVLVLASGTPGQRSITEGTLISLHEHALPFADVGSIRGTANDWRANAERIRNSVERVYWMLGKVSSRDEKFWRGLLVGKSDVILSVQEALKYGLVDNVVSLHT